ncbi:hypothetical protein N7452_004266 [Penicillium brevicompactum]|uniref:Uncharacterized protein n=1 Tax=Penicillium brevicompactum TaxID=5074 RepID=A0A9W9QV97_PENBR|nr:hypothetical protein N7452_004266 [Penicillium brevicompactum]
MTRSSTTVGQMNQDKGPYPELTQDLLPHSSYLVETSSPTHPLGIIVTSIRASPEFSRLNLGTRPSISIYHWYQKREFQNKEEND